MAMSGPVTPSRSDHIEQRDGILSRKESDQTPRPIPHSRRPPLQQAFDRMSGTIHRRILRHLPGFQQDQDVPQRRHPQFLRPFAKNGGARRTVKTRRTKHLILFSSDIHRLGRSRIGDVREIDRQDMRRNAL